MLAPPPGVEYSYRSDLKSDDGPVIPMPSDSVIGSAKATDLKSILKAAGLKVSGKKDVLVQRVLDGKNNNDITGENFPVSMRPTVGGSAKDRCTLIVCPVSVMSNWQLQVDTHVKEGVLDLRIYHGPNRHEVLPDVQAGAVDILLVSYHTLAAEFSTIFGDNTKESGEPQKKRFKRASLFDINFHRIVLDEAVSIRLYDEKKHRIKTKQFTSNCQYYLFEQHTIRSSKTKFFKGVKKIKADRKLALTGTPFVNRADDVHSLLSFLGVEPLSDKGIFRRAITQLIKNGDEMGLTRLRTCMGCVSLRRSKALVDINLVEKEVQLCSVTFPNDAHKIVYDALYGTLRIAMEAILSEGDGSAVLKNYTSIFEKLLRLRQACCAGTLVSLERRELALKTWREVQGRSGEKKLTAEEGLALLEKLKGAFTEVQNSLPECGICLMEMEETVSILVFPFSFLSITLSFSRSSIYFRIAPF